MRNPNPVWEGGARRCHVGECGEGLTQHGRGRQQLVVAGLLPAVLQRVGALVGQAPQHDVFALLGGALGGAARLGRLHCGEGTQRRE